MHWILCYSIKAHLSSSLFSRCQCIYTSPQDHFLSSFAQFLLILIISLLIYLLYSFLSCLFGFSNYATEICFPFWIVKCDERNSLYNLLGELKIQPNSFMVINSIWEINLMWMIHECLYLYVHMFLSIVFTQTSPKIILWYKFPL